MVERSGRIVFMGLGHLTDQGVDRWRIEVGPAENNEGESATTYGNMPECMKAEHKKNPDLGPPQLAKHCKNLVEVEEEEEEEVVEEEE